MTETYWRAKQAADALYATDPTYPVAVAAVAKEAKSEKVAVVFGWALRAISFGIIFAWQGWAFGLTAIGISLIIEDLYRRMGRS